MNNTWQKRATTMLSCPSGNQVEVRRTGPDLAIKAGRFARVLKKLAGPDGKPLTAEEQVAKIAELPDDELEQVMAFARVVVADVCVSPRLYLRPVNEQLGPDDLPLSDFWYINTWAMSGGPTMPVATKEGETDIESVGNFPGESEPGISSGSDSEAVQ